MGTTMDSIEEFLLYLHTGQDVAGFNLRRMVASQFDFPAVPVPFRLSRAGSRLFSARQGRKCVARRVWNNPPAFWRRRAYIPAADYRRTERSGGSAASIRVARVAS